MSSFNVDTAPTPANAATSRHEFYAGASAGRTALIVDDNQRNRFALSQCCSSEQDDRICRRQRHASARTLAQTADVDIVLMDIMMPVMDCYQTVAAIRKRPQCSDLPIIAVTAEETGGERERCSAAGASDYIPKAINAAELLTAVSHWLPAPRVAVLIRG